MFVVCTCYFSPLSTSFVSDTLIKGHSFLIRRLCGTRVTGPLSRRLYDLHGPKVALEYARSNKSVVTKVFCPTIFRFKSHFLLLLLQRMTTCEMTPQIGHTGTSEVTSILQTRYGSISRGFIYLMYLSHVLRQRVLVVGPSTDHASNCI